ncbi:MAG: DEAD/DEAH box helicase [Candidatus Omnitrophica bacterium]|nr:DEAD/DEAH box helicase [Candidatus Omnitrophota bacterium]
MKPLFKHQKEALDFIVSNNGFGALFHEVGCGKTRTALEIFSHYKRLDPELKLFVICPLSLINSAWGEDIKQFTCFNYRNCHDETIELRKDTDIYIINFESLISENKIKQLHKMINFSKVMCVIDESSKMKNHKARTTKTLLSLRNYFNFRIIMSGTPAPNCETEYWAQINFIKPGIVHEKFYPFRYFYFHLERERNGKQEFTSGQIYSKLAAQQIFQRGWHYDITTQKRQLLMDKISPYCHYARKAECLDLPEQMDEVRLVDMGKKQASVYNSMKRDLIAEIQNSFVVAQVALAKIMKLRQITSGFAIDESGETIIIGENPKLQELKDVLEEAGKQQVIIWCQFQHEIRQIKDLLGDKAVTLYGETKDKDDSITAFKNGSAQYLIAHPKSAGHGLTFVNCSLQVFYSLDYSWELYEQARGRIHRAGQVNKCTYVHLLCKGTIDEEILNVLRNKKDATEILYRMVQGNLAEVGK